MGKKFRNQWWAKMLAKHGSKEAVREVMRQYANKSSRNRTGNNYFKKLKETDPELLREISSNGGTNRHIKRDTKQTE